jgi:hypothetical protein
MLLFKYKSPNSDFTSFLAWLLTLSGLVLCSLLWLHQGRAAETVLMTKSKNQPVMQINVLLDQDHSMLANLLRDRHSRLSTAFALWAETHSEKSAREWCRQILETIKCSAQTKADRIESLITFSRLSSQLQALEGAPCGFWIRGSNTPEHFWVPRLLLEPGASGLRGALADILETLPVRFSFPRRHIEKHQRLQILERAV